MLWHKLDSRVHRTVPKSWYRLGCMEGQQLPMQQGSLLYITNVVYRKSKGGIQFIISVARGLAGMMLKDYPHQSKKVQSVFLFPNS